ncbi:MAG: Ig-like domain repeat protein [Actinomycetota bacterium]|nr:Ig-like domain repeat protein [Actinomycetota bacterium]
MKRILSTVAALAVVGSGIGMASSASAAPTVNLNAKNGVVGVAQTIDASVSDSAVIGAPSGTVTFYSNGAVIGTDTVGGNQGSNAQIVWTPKDSGPDTLMASFSGGGSDTETVSVNSVDTTSSVTAPGSAAAGSQVALQAQVRAKQGSYVPTGTVTFTTSSATIGTASLNAQGLATINFTVPTGVSSVNVYAAYGGNANANASGRSSAANIRVSAVGSTVALSVPQTNYQNTSVPLSAKITPATGTGTVTFTVDGRTIGTATVANGAASVTWVPTALGNPTVKAAYTGGNGVAASSDSKVVAVTQALKADAITVDPVGDPGPILNGAVFVLPNGSSVAATVTAASGLPVKVAVTGPCAWNGTTFTVQGVGGNCSVVTTTAGGNGYAPATMTFAISTALGKQTASVVAPKTGTYKKGRFLTMAKAGTVTNLNKALVWKVTSGASVCKLYRSAGAVKLKLAKRGSCWVQAFAPAVPGQWSSFLTKRNYRVR